MRQHVPSYLAICQAPCRANAMMPSWSNWNEPTAVLATCSYVDRSSKMHHGSICSLILAFLCAPTLSWQLLIPRQHANHQHKYYGYRHKRKHAERQGATFSSHNTCNRCLWPWTSHDNAPTNVCKSPIICPIVDIGICTRNLSMAVASILLALVVVPTGTSLGNNARCRECRECLDRSRAHGHFHRF